ncbi:MAG: hypothetical protein JSU59_06975 [Nitrospirota bacterium]|nr:MAG: hypothetical protein JSU59_06975 [Nitrospirota bacterium]
MIELDEVEQSALKEFLHVLEEQHFESKPTVLTSRINRTADNQIMVPLSVKGESPSLHMALLMSHKAEQIYKQTACRLVLGQCPEKDPNGQIYVWIDNQWTSLP